MASTTESGETQGESRWHWAEGTKYAVEAGGSLMLINGAAAAGILTFVGNHQPKAFEIFRSINIFAIGALLSAVFFGFAYAAQLQYGNRALKIPRSTTWVKIWRYCAYLSAAASIIMFVWGAYTATEGLSKG